MHYKLNLIPSPLDNRDFIFKTENVIRKIKSYPDSLDFRDDLMPVRNQGAQGTCYAQSASCMKEWQEKQNYGFDTYFSPQFFYNLRQNKYDEDDNNNEGMIGRDVMKLLKTYGICSEKLYPYGLIEDKDIISEKIYNAAKINIIQAYAKVNTIDDLKTSLYLNGPALVGFPVYNYTGQMWKKRSNESFKGGHAMTIVGYNEEGFLIRNSWGGLWNDNGYTIYNYEDWGAHWEIWSCVDKKDIIPLKPTDDDTIEDLRDAVDNETTQESFCDKLYNKFLWLI
jgi:C1A family cysteine protease